MDGWRCSVFHSVAHSAAINVAFIPCVDGWLDGRRETEGGLTLVVGMATWVSVSAVVA